jgi:hypothetical protein
MKTMMFAAAATLAVALGAASASAEGPRASSGNAIFQTAEKQPVVARSAAPHYEWQYHYVGHHPRLEGYWALVR